ncbi:uncharacterized protein YNL144C-like [Punica granatum]|uniref:Uncharacterized protein YNL144C-like n=2 Tax=Punica granatum TaxID=22663 RepID=A0A6P8ELZ3_PUNGR|nr:uncharacterized protein YNL144C-like [Punica granatum]XP_031406894.1 uncharacterized protein YNL144C-like [Punica granatum]OWM88769.1 hypothetical protein CDL15_Pgr002536 [Punica granatum]PKI55839.1 hypothetical protein CRG98_023720 [Punica granatum]
MDRYGNYYYQRSGLWRTLRDGDFEESEVWDVLREGKDQRAHDDQTSLPNEHTNHYASSHLPSAAKMVPQSSISGSGGSSSSSSAPRSIFTHQSAPVNIPNWSKVHKHLGRSESSKAPKSRPWRNTDDDDEEEGEEEDDDDREEDDYDDEDDGYGQKLPPHEYVAMKLARSKMSSFSVLEGVGRKLKGRDLSKVRNDVLTKTGFLESP